MDDAAKFFIFICIVITIFRLNGIDLLKRS